jgi:hypothetical protein
MLQLRRSRSLLVSALSPFAFGAFGAFGALAFGCSSEPGGPREPETVVSPTTPAEPSAPAAGSDTGEAPAAHATLAMSPSCGAPGTRVVLRLDWTSDKRVPDCVRAEEFDVRFGSKVARITELGKMNEGWCALDVLVPKGASSTTVTVSVGHDVFDSTTTFASPCP